MNKRTTKKEVDKIIEVANKAVEKIAIFFRVDLDAAGVEVEKPAGAPQGELIETR